MKLHILGFLCRIIPVSSRMIFFLSLESLASYHFCNLSLPCRLKRRIKWIMPDVRLSTTTCWSENLMSKDLPYCTTKLPHHQFLPFPSLPLVNTYWYQNNAWSSLNLVITIIFTSHKLPPTLPDVGITSVSRGSTPLCLCCSPLVYTSLSTVQYHLLPCCTSLPRSDLTVQSGHKYRALFIYYLISFDDFCH